MHKILDEFKIRSDFLKHSSKHYEICRYLGNYDGHEILDEFEILPDRTTYFGVTCLWMPKKPVFDLIWSIACLIYIESLWNWENTRIGITSWMGRKSDRTFFSLRTYMPLSAEETYLTFWMTWVRLLALNLSSFEEIFDCFFIFLCLTKLY